MLDDRPRRNGPLRGRKFTEISSADLLKYFWNQEKVSLSDSLKDPTSALKVSSRPLRSDCTPRRRRGYRSFVLGIGIDRMETFGLHPGGKKLIHLPGFAQPRAKSFRATRNSCNIYNVTTFRNISVIGSGGGRRRVDPKDVGPRVSVSPTLF